MFEHHFSFDPLQQPLVSTIRQAVFPEVRLPVPDAQGQPAVFDLRQEQYASGLGAGHRIIYGVAGSGKSLVVAYRAKYLAAANPGWRILVTCFNVSMAAHMGTLVERTRPDLALGPGSIEVGTLHQVCANLLGEAEESAPVEDGDVDALPTRLLDAMERGKIERRYQAVLVDEGQDFSPEWLKATVQLLDPDTNSLLIVLDECQRIYPRRPSWSSVGIEAQGRTRTLQTAYRNTREIIDLARRYAGLGERANEAGAPDQQVLPLFVDRHGPPPELIHCGSVPDTFTHVAGLVRSWLNEGRPPAHIGILYARRNMWQRRRQSNVIEHLGRALAASDIPFEHIDTREAKARLDLDSETVKVLTIKSAKGLEWTNVVVIGLDTLPLRGNSDAETTALVYVAITRARERLVMLHTGDNNVTRRVRRLLADV
jgi:superfamily I DNA/RNA helicase